MEGNDIHMEVEMEWTFKGRGREILDYRTGWDEK